MTTAGPSRTTAPRADDLATHIARIEADPHDLGAWRQAVACMLTLGAFADAVGAQKQVAALSPGKAEPWTELARIQGLAGARLDVIVDCLQQALRLEPSNHVARVRLGMTLLHHARIEEAGRCFAHVLKVVPDHMDARAGAALVLDRQGDHASAWALIEQTKGPPSNHLGAAAATVARHAGVPDRGIGIVKRARKRAVGLDKALLSFSLGDLQEAAGRHHDAWRSWATGNRGRGHTFDCAAHDRSIQAILQRTRAPLPQVGPSDPRPVFVVGVPRSGTTLLETLLDAHSALRGIGESDAIARIGGCVARRHGTSTYFDALDGIPALGPELGAAYLDELDRLAPGALRTIDKMPNNALHLALVSCILPGARVIWCERDPDDVAVSCFQKAFGAGLPWASSLAGIRCWQRNLQRLKSHWLQTLPLDILTVRYEDVVDDPEREVRRVTTFLDVAFEPAMLDFHRERRHVATASFDQINEPIHARRVGRAERYRAFLT